MRTLTESLGCRGAPLMRTLTESLGQDVEVLLSCGL